MELDNLKSLWQEQGQPAQKTVSATDLFEILKKNSKHPIAMIKRNVLLELWVMIISYTAMIVYFGTKEQGLYINNAIFVAVFLFAGLFYYSRKISLLNKMQNNTDQIKINLIKHLNLLKKYVRFYYWFGVFLLPLVYFITYLMVIVARGQKEFPEKTMWENITTEDSLVVFVITGVVLTLISPFVNGWYVKKLYGSHLNKLENLVKQVDE